MDRDSSDTQVTLTSAERRLGFVLRLTAFGLFIAALAYGFGPLLDEDFFKELPFVANSMVKVTILGLVSLYAAGDIRRRSGLVVILILAHLVSVAAMGSMLAFAETGKEVDLWGFDTEVGTVLWGAIGLDGLITLGIAGFFYAAWRSTRGIGRPQPEGERALTSGERLLRWVLVAFAVLFVLGGIAGPARAVRRLDQGLRAGTPLRHQLRRADGDAGDALRLRSSEPGPQHGGGRTGDRGPVPRGRGRERLPDRAVRGDAVGRLCSGKRGG